MYNKYNIGFPHKLKDCSLLYSCVYMCGLLFPSKSPRLIGTLYLRRQCGVVVIAWAS